jgi:putative lipase involved disintegration of autophagic bodies
MSETSPIPAVEAETACHLCGQEAVIVVDGKGWCASCLHARGSCCAESEMEEE